MKLLLMLMFAHGPCRTDSERMTYALSVPGPEVSVYLYRDLTGWIHATPLWLA